jgi:hypothetical protein
MTARKSAALWPEMILRTGVVCGNTLSTGLILL